MRIIDVYNQHPNADVTKYYVETVLEALQKNGIVPNRINKLKKCKEKRSMIFVVTPIDAILARVKGYTNVICWVQGIVPEESFIRNHSRVRFYILSCLEKIGLNCAYFNIFVSEEMRKHYKEKYDYDCHKYYVMPCFNTEINEKLFYTKNKYANNVFVYTGGLQPWQCFVETVEIYKKIEKVVPDSIFKVFTRDQEKAKEILDKSGVERYVVDCVPQEKLSDEIANAKFGFALRRETEVNRCATPTKLSTYIGSGVIPIYTDSIGSFYSIAKNNKYCISININEVNTQRILELCNQQIDPTEVLNAYKNTFGNYYSQDYHIKELSNCFFDNGIGEKNSEV